MDYFFWFWIIVAFILGRKLPRKIYIGNDEAKYKETDFGLLLIKKRRI